MSTCTHAHDASDDIGNITLQSRSSLPWLLETGPAFESGRMIVVQALEVQAFATVVEEILEKSFRGANGCCQSRLLWFVLLCFLKAMHIVAARIACRYPQAALDCDVQRLYKRPEPLLVCMCMPVLFTISAAAMSSLLSVATGLTNISRTLTGFILFMEAGPAALTGQQDSMTVCISDVAQSKDAACWPTSQQSLTTLITLVSLTKFFSPEHAPASS